MAIINCPECNSEISDTAKSCPKCGYEITPAKPPRKTNQMKLGAIINIIGGLGFILMLVALMLSGSNADDAEVTMSINVSDSYTVFNTVAYVLLLIVTVISIVLVILKKLPRRTALIITGIQLALAVVSLIFLLISWNFAVCCVGWIVMWGNVLQFIGSILCLAGALKFND